MSAPLSDGALQSPKRRYLALLARASDQAGEPEGELCQRLADRLADQWPELLDVDEVQPVEMFELRWKRFHERELLVRAAKYFGVTPQGWAGRRSQTKVVLVTTDRPTRDLIVHAFESQRDRLWDMISWTVSGFLMGSMPLPSGDSDDGDEIDDDLLALALAAMRMGQGSQPRPALPEASS